MTWQSAKFTKPLVLLLYNYCFVTLLDHVLHCPRTRKTTACSAATISVATFHFSIQLSFLSDENTETRHLGARHLGAVSCGREDVWTRNMFKRIFDQVFVIFFEINKNFSVCNDLFQ